MPAPAASALIPERQTTISVRAARPEDCPSIAQMIRDLAAFQGVGDRVHVTAEGLHQDGFGPQRKFEALIAEQRGRHVGLAMFQEHYSVWDGASVLQITDMFVDEGVRGTGVGFRLSLEVARIARDRGCAGLQLNMVHANPSRDSLDRMGFFHQDDLLHYRLDAAGLNKLLEQDR
jgi:GNAT superfamily N-acetyltransferase